MLKRVLGGGGQGDPAPYPPGARCLFGCRHCTCFAPGTRHTQTACFWKQSQLPAQTEISFQNSVVREKKNQLGTKGVLQLNLVSECP